MLPEAVVQSPTPPPKTPVRLIGLSVALGLPRAWLKAEALAGRLPCLRVGRNTLLFDPDAVRAALARRAALGEGVRAEGGDADAI
jgi:hypothetical protein